MTFKIYNFLKYKLLTKLDINKMIGLMRGLPYLQSIFGLHYFGQPSTEYLFLLFVMKYESCLFIDIIDWLINIEIYSQT